MTSPSDPANQQADHPPRRDTLTIGRCLLLTAGVAVGLGVFIPSDDGDMFQIDWALGLYNAVLIGMSIPAPLIVIGQRRRAGPPIGPGGLFALMTGLGSLLMLPPVLVQRLGGNPRGVSLLCLFYMLPLVSVWYLAAALIAGKLGRELFARSTAWTERYGFFLVALWTPMGIWWLIRFYWDAFH